MVKCQSCGTVSDKGRFCSSCGQPFGSDVLATVDGEVASPPPLPRVPKNPSAQPRTSSGGLASQGRFLPGTLLVQRYRIVALLGKGGMGEVYRADDLTLGQPVALKFLPEAARDEDTLARFRNEVRTARRVSHPNLCRVYDVGEASDQTFLSMEYVDGEDLASLLRRIGRLPADKALEIARQLCAGLAAAHREGVLHRDLKPANVMLDGRGRAVITDFGLAGLADQIQGLEVRSGTPPTCLPSNWPARKSRPGATSIPSASSSTRSSRVSAPLRAKPSPTWCARAATSRQGGRQA
jgi:serine/threonine protein kinase